MEALLGARDLPHLVVRLLRAAAHRRGTIDILVIITNMSITNVSIDLPHLVVRLLRAAAHRRGTIDILVITTNMSITNMSMDLPHLVVRLLRAAAHRRDRAQRLLQLQHHRHISYYN